MDHCKLCDKKSKAFFAKELCFLLFREVIKVLEVNKLQGCSNHRLSWRVGFQKKVQETNTIAAKYYKKLSKCHKNETVIFQSC